MPTSWDETHGYTQALIAMKTYLDEASYMLSKGVGHLAPGDMTCPYNCAAYATI